MALSEREVLKNSLAILRSVFKSYVKIERRQVAMFRNPSGQTLRFGKKGESDIGGWIIRGPYIAKPIAIEVKRGDFRPSHVYGEDLVRFKRQCDYIRTITHEGGVGFWLCDPGVLYSILMPVLKDGAKVGLDINNRVCVTCVNSMIQLEKK